MQLTFYKYQGTGNDFVMIDNRTEFFPKNNTKLVEQLCDRRFGIGADGLILLENHPQYDFKMVYYNSDGNESSMCGNGGRCLVAFAKQMGVIENKAEFEAVDGYHYATIDIDGIVALQMKDVDTVNLHESYTFLNTGSPHHVQIVNDLKSLENKLNVADKNSTLLYLGDNIYPSGMPTNKDKNRNEAENKLQEQISITNKFKGKTIFIPGNHDWYSNGNEGLKRQQEYVENRLGKKSFLPLF